MPQTTRSQPRPPLASPATRLFASLADPGAASSSAPDSSRSPAAYARSHGAAPDLFWLAIGVFYTVAYLFAGWILLDWPGLLVWFRTIALVVPPLAGIVAIVRRRHVWAGCQWLFWATIALGLTISAIGFVGWALDELILGRETSWLGWHAVFGLFGASAPLLALLAQPHRGRQEAVVATTAVDIAGIAVVAGFLYSYFVMGGEWTRDGRPALALMFLAELQQLVVCAGLTAAAVVARGRPWGQIYRRLAWGAGLSVAMMTLGAAGIWQGEYRSVFVYDFTWILPFFFYPWAAAAAPASIESVPDPDDAALAPSRPWLVFGALAAIPLVDAGLRAVVPLEASLGQYRDVSMAVTLLSVLPLLMARLVVERAEARKADARLRLLAAAIEQTDDLVCVFTEDGRVEHANAAFCRAVGYSQAEIAALSFGDLTAGGPPPAGDENLATGAWRGALVRRRQDGTTFVSAATIVPLVDGRGAVTHFVAVERDVTDEARLSHQLLQSERRYRSLFDNAPLGIYRATTEGRLLTVNQALVDMLGFSTIDELLARNVMTLQKDPARGVAMLHEWRTRGPVAIETAWIRRSGAEIVLRLSGQPMLDERTGEEAFEVFAEDVTEHRALEEEFRQAQKMEAVGRLAGGVAHDFNNQLTVILGYTDLLLAQIGEDKPMTPDLREIRRAAESASSLTRQLLAFSRRQLLRLDIVNLNDVVLRVDPMLRRLIGADVMIETRLRADLDPIKADPSQLEQVLLNLAVNARDAMVHGGTLTLLTAPVEVSEPHHDLGAMKIRPGRYVVLTVSDTGCGMDAATKARIFEPFFTTKEQGRGTGLGLATVYGIVKQLGGYIGVESAPNQGATFTLYFPAAREAARPLEVQDAPRVPHVGRETILLVEDQDAVRAFTAKVLARHGYHVLEAPSGDEAIAIAESEVAIDLVVADVVLPGLSGPELLAQLRARRRVKAVLMSGYADKVLRNGAAAGPIEIIQKPFTPADLLQTVRQALDAGA